jgi:hypothetical protein
MQSYKKYFSNKNYLMSFFDGLFLLSASLILQFYANAYTIRKASSSVTDVILSNTTAHDVDGLFVWGSVLMFFACIFICLRKVNYLPFVMKSIALFTAIRAFFISLTHISPYPNHAEISSLFFQHNIFNGILTGDGMFFSGHTGLPFLLALTFWENKVLRVFFLGLSIFFAFVVLLGHLHYSIDVFSAYFITYTIFQICKHLFHKERAILLE